MSDKTTPITGGCLCGAVRYEASKLSAWGGYCHCRMCQRAYGGLFGVFADFPTESFRYTRGKPTYYQSSPWAKRGFCGSCGSPIEFRYLDSSTLGIPIGTLDHPEAFPPKSHHSGIESKVSWHVISDDLPQKRTDESQYFQAAQARYRDAADAR